MTRRWLSLTLLAAGLAASRPAAPLRAAVATAPYAYAPAACQSAPFPDVPANHPFCAWIQRFALDQVSTGCGGGNYCPEDPVTRAQLADMLERAMRGTAGWEPWRGAYRRTLIVNPKVDGLNPVESGARLLAHLAEIDNASAANPYLIKLEPGVYDLDGGFLALEPFVDLEGSGEGVTTIRSARNGGIVFGADDVEVRGLTVENPGNGGIARVFDLSGDDATRLRNVTVWAHGGTSIDTGVFNAGDGAVLDRVRVLAQGSGAADALAVSISGNATLRAVDVQATSAADAWGIEASSGTSTITDSTVFATGSVLVHAIAIETGASATLRRVTGTASSLSGGSTAAGIYLLDGNATIYDGSFSGAATNAYGLLVNQISGSHTVRILNSRLAGSDHTVQGDSSYSISIGDSQLAGGPASAGGATLVCYGVYDESFVNAGGLAACP